MLAEFSAAFSSLKAAFEIANAAHELTNYNDLVTALSEVNIKLMQAQTVAIDGQAKLSLLNSENSELKEKLREIEDWEGQIKRYKLYEFPTKALAHALQPNMDHGEPLHYICTTCVGQRQKTILQPKGRFLYCPVHNSTIETVESPPLPSFSGD